MTTAIGVRGRYVDTVNPDDVKGTIKVEGSRWTVDGPHHQHEFRYVMEARTSDRFIIHDNFVEHWMGGKLVERFGWGHGTVEAYKSSQTWQKQTGCWYVDLVSAHIFRHDLPCCGGKFVLTKEYTGYSTLCVGYCDGCRKKWEIGDEHHFMPGR